MGLRSDESIDYREGWQDGDAAFDHVVITGAWMNDGVVVFVENPWPSVVPHMREVKGSLVNVLLDASKKDYRFKRNSSGSHTSSKSLRDRSARKNDSETLNSNVD